MAYYPDLIEENAIEPADELDPGIYVLRCANCRKLFHQTSAIIMVSVRKGHSLYCGSNCGVIRRRRWM